MTAVNGASFSRTVSAVVRASDMVPRKQEAFYEAFVGSGCRIPTALRDDWLGLVELCRTNDSELAKAAEAVPVEWEPDEPALEAEAAAGAEQSIACYLERQAEQGGIKAVWASAVLAAGKTNERPAWLDCGVAGFAKQLLRADITVSDEMSKELAARVTGVLSREFGALAELSQSVDVLRRDLDVACSSGATITDAAMDSFGRRATAIHEGDERFVELMLETALVERYEDLIHPDARSGVAEALRKKLWVNAPRVDPGNKTPITALFDQSVDYVSSVANEVLVFARGFGIRPVDKEEL